MEDINKLFYDIERWNKDILQAENEKAVKRMTKRANKLYNEWRNLPLSKSSKKQLKNWYSKAIKAIKRIRSKLAN